MADLRWDSINANFNDANSAMDNSIRGISQVGTVFGDLRKSILDEEQRAVDNAYNENKLREQIRYNQESERLTGDGQKVQMRGQDLSHKAAMAGVGVQKDSLALARSEQDQNALFRKDYAEITSSLYGQRDSLDQQITQGKTELEAAQAAGTITPEQLKERQAQLDRLATQRKELSDTAMQASIQREMGMRGWGGDRAIVTPSDNLATTEQARAVAGVEMSQKQQQAYEQSQVKANELVAGLNLGQEDTAALQKAMTMIQQTYPRLKPEVAMSILTNFYPTTGEILSFKNDKFDVPIFDTDYIVNFDPNDGNNPIALRIAEAGSNSSNLIGGGNSDTSQIPQQQTPGTRLVNLSGLTPEALDYREQQILKGLPDPESLNTNSEQVQARFNQLYRTSYGDVPRSEVPDSALKTLEERALQDARNTIQQMRTQVTSQFKNERNRRQRIEAFSSLDLRLVQ